ncbi:uncharacterized protein LW94_2719 [Fusarium fujikuroi]|nr:uncharacterized protein LW94_2719 [Fusarium fujikuroi]SCO55559.1 uncharacterized protein FFMR_12715 [Fusarium fujikuroi]
MAIVHSEYVTVHVLKQDGLQDPKHLSIEEFINGGLKEFRGKDEIKLCWLHIPVNHVAWAERCIQSWCDAMEGDSMEDLRLKQRPSLPEHASIPWHARHMEPSCSASKEARGVGEKNNEYESHAAQTSQVNDNPKQRPLLTLLVPYMNWETYGNFCSLHSSYQDSLGSTRTTESATRSRRQTGERTLAQSLSDDEKSLHPRRTLDQFYYPSLRDTASRDRDQTISKWTSDSSHGEDSRHDVTNDSRMIMVDQLWCWVLDHKTMLSCFPSGDLQYTSNGEFIDLYTGIQHKWFKHNNIWDAYSTVIKETFTCLFCQENKRFIDLVEIYRWVISEKAAKQTTFFQSFSSAREVGELSSEHLNGHQELALVLEIADIIDELNMMRHLIQKQREVLKSLIMTLRKLNPTSDSNTDRTGLTLSIQSNTVAGRGQMNVLVNHHEGLTDLAESIKILAQGISGRSRDIVISTDDDVLTITTELSILKSDAEYNHKMLLDLLNLMQTAAALAEARSTTQQGRAIMLFTIVTIVFLPLSFFTSYFGQNIFEITGDENNPHAWDLWRYGSKHITYHSR